MTVDDIRAAIWAEAIGQREPIHRVAVRAAIRVGPISRDITVLALRIDRAIVHLFALPNAKHRSFLAGPVVRNEAGCEIACEGVGSATTIRNRPVSDDF